MEYKISKELFEEVTGLSDFEKYEVDGDYIWIKRDGGYNRRYYSVNDFFFMCKEWAYSLGYRIKSEFAYTFGYSDVMRIGSDDIVNTSTGESEQQAVFNVCQWILEQKDKQ